MDIENQLLERWNRPPITVEQYRTHFDLPIKLFYEKIGFSFDPDSGCRFEEVMAQFWDAYRLRSRHECGLFDGVHDLLQVQQDAGYTHSILSSLPHQQLTEAVTRFGLGDFFGIVSGHDDDSAGSKLRRGNLLLAQLGVEPDKVVFIGDTTHDFDVAHTLGVDALLVTIGHQSAQRLQQKTAQVFDSVAAVAQYIDRAAPATMRT